MEIWNLLLLGIIYVTLFFGLFWILIYLNGQPVQRKSKRKPFVSILVPAHNEEKVIAESVKNLKQLKYPRFEIIVIDDESSDRTAELAKKAGARVISPKRSGKAGALNQGLKIAKGEIIAVVDADTLVAKDALENAVKYMTDDIAAVIARICVENDETALGSVQRLEYNISNFGRMMASWIGCLNILPGALSLIRRDVLDSVGPFDTDSITEDYEMGMRIVSQGHKIAYAQESLAYTHVPANISSWFRQRIRWFRGRVETLWKYKHMLFNKKYYPQSHYLAVELLSFFVIFMTTLITIRYAYTFSKKIYLFVVSKFISQMLPVFGGSIPIMNIKNRILFSNWTVNLFLFVSGYLFLFQIGELYKNWNQDKEKPMNFLIFFLIYTRVLAFAWLKGGWNVITGAEKKW
ncbi:MAG: glycosyltransferase family 2 protein [Candidatus Altiarchaeota archaeon]|nr:glycosyltransferase family 2 protein [Candidatus Altiarchaeota archaeon]